MEGIDHRLCVCCTIPFQSYWRRSRRRRRKRHAHFNRYFFSRTRISVHPRRNSSSESFLKHSINWHRRWCSTISVNQQRAIMIKATVSWNPRQTQQRMVKPMRISIVFYKNWNPSAKYINSKQSRWVNPMRHVSVRPIEAFTGQPCFLVSPTKMGSTPTHVLGSLFADPTSKGRGTKSGTPSPKFKQEIGTIIKGKKMKKTILDGDSLQQILIKTHGDSSEPMHIVLTSPMKHQLSPTSYSPIAPATSKKTLVESSGTWMTNHISPSTKNAQALALKAVARNQVTKMISQQQSQPMDTGTKSEECHSM